MYLGQIIRKPRRVDKQTLAAVIFFLVLQAGRKFYFHNDLFYMYTTLSKKN